MRISLGCALCERQVVAAGRSICATCEAETHPTPLRDWRSLHDVKLSRLVEDTGLSRRTVVRADAGERVSHDAAMTLAAHTGMHWRKFRPKEE